jgi:hypothetical protein
MKSNILTFIIGISLLMSACKKAEPRSLDEVEKQELAKGIRNNTLFLGLNFGMTQKEFFAVCWDLNKKGTLREASGNMAAAYQLDKGELDHPAEMNFYPKYKDDKISEMPIRFHYKGWAPWNEDLQSKKLIVDVKKLMEKWYGTGGFFISPLPEGGKGIVKVDGNRRIVITIDSESEVLVMLSDLTVVK